MTTQASWSLRTILGPILTRLTIYGTHPVDIEQAMQHIENQPMRNALDLEKNWAAYWHQRAEHYLSVGEQSHSAFGKARMQQLATQCYYAQFLINYRDGEQKKLVYQTYAASYQQAQRLTQRHCQLIKLPYQQSHIQAYLHCPEGDGPFPCSIVLPGLGSCKEEMDMLVQPLLARGIAALVPDLPGVGSAIYQNHLTCQRSTLLNSIAQMVSWLTQQPNIRHNAIGTTGLCMGGGLAFMAAANDQRIAFTATLFPLIINQVSADKVPLWMKSGPWFELIAGDQDSDSFIEDMGLTGNEQLASPFFMAHSEHDNWMTLAQAKTALFERATGDKQLLVVEQPAVLSQDASTTHTMPVGEQMHWVKEVLADWVLSTTEATSE